MDGLVQQDQVSATKARPFGVILLVLHGWYVCLPTIQEPPPPLQSWLAASGAAADGPGTRQLCL